MLLTASPSQSEYLRKPGQHLGSDAAAAVDDDHFWIVKLSSGFGSAGASITGIARTSRSRRGAALRKARNCARAQPGLST